MQVLHKEVPEQKLLIDHGVVWIHRVVRLLFCKKRMRVCNFIG